MGILTTLIDRIIEEYRREPVPTHEQARAIAEAYEQEVRKAILHRPWWWRLIGRDHVKRSSGQQVGK